MCQAGSGVLANNSFAILIVFLFVETGDVRPFDEPVAMPEVPLPLL
jgi:hypothetical protein